MSAPAQEKKSFGKFKHVKLREEEFNQLLSEYGQEMVERLIDEMDLWFARGKGLKEKSHFHTFKAFANKDLKQPKQEQKNDFTSKKRVKTGATIQLSGEFVNGIRVGD